MILSRTFVAARRALLATTLLATSAAAQFEPTWFSNQVPTGGLPGRLGRGQKVALDASGAVFAAGALPVAAVYDSLVACKYDANGTPLWSTQILASPALHKVRALALSASGKCAVAGRRNAGLGLSPSATILSLLGPTGVVEWTQIGATYGESTYDDVVFDAAGNIIVCGSHGPVGLVRKFDPLGNLIWQSAATNQYRYVSLVLDPSGDVIAVGPGTSHDVSVVRFDGTNGSVVWSRLTTGTGEDEMFRLLQTPSGELVVSGKFGILVGQHSEYGYGAMQLDALGNVQWLTLVPGLRGAYDPHGVALSRDALGRIVLVGRTQSIGIQAAVLDSTGGILWSRTLNLPLDFSYATAGEIVTDAAGTIYAITSDTYETVDTTSHAVVSVFDSSGEQRFVWDPRTTDPVNYPRELNSLALDANGALIVLGNYLNGRYYAARLERTSRAFCFGDGSATACPCGNATPIWENTGCASSLGAGARLIDSGASSIANDTFALKGSAMPNSSALYFQGTQSVAGGTGSVFGDGLRCAGGSILRLGVKLNVAGTSSYPTAGDAPVSVRGLVPGPATSRTYQVWYRNSASFCTSSTFNLTNGLEVTWTN